MKVTTEFIIVVLLQFVSLPASGQTLGGVVIDRATREPVAGVLVALHDSATVVRGSTDSSGLFYLTVPRAGLYRLRLGPEGPEQVVVDSIVIGADEFVQRAFAIPVRRFYLEFEVDTSVRQSARTVTLQYPPELHSSGVEGEVLAQFVVDTTGRVRVGSFKAFRATDWQFVDAVRAALPTLRFFPAMLHGIKVAQLVQQPFTFRMGPYERPG